LVYIADRFIDHGKVYAACSGNDISDGMSVKRIKAGDREYDISAVHVVKSFIGIPQAMLEFVGNVMPPIGEVVIIR